MLSEGSRNRWLHFGDILDYHKDPEIFWRILYHCKRGQLHMQILMTGKIRDASYESNTQLCWRNKLETWAKCCIFMQYSIKENNCYFWHQHEGWGFCKWLGQHFNILPERKCDIPLRQTCSPCKTASTSCVRWLWRCKLQCCGRLSSNSTLDAFKVKQLQNTDPKVIFRLHLFEGKIQTDHITVSPPKMA